MRAAIRLLNGLSLWWSMIYCGITTKHAQFDGSAFCRCCYRLYPVNEQTREIFNRKKATR